MKAPLTRWARVLEVVGTLRAAIGLDDVVLVLALALLTIAAWPLAEAAVGSGRVALAIPGLACLWLSLPTRSSFISRPPVPRVKDANEIARRRT